MIYITVSNKFTLLYIQGQHTKTATGMKAPLPPPHRSQSAEPLIPPPIMVILMGDLITDKTRNARK